MHEIKNRVVFGLIAIAVVTALILETHAIGLYVICILFGGLAIKELSELSGINAVYLVVLQLLWMLLFFLLPYFVIPWVWGALWSVILLGLYFNCSKSMLFHLYNFGIGCSWFFTFLLWQLSPFSLLLGLALVWLIDSVAFFVGKLWGRKKLAPTISPNKTIEGTVGGLFVGLIWPFIPIKGVLVATVAIVGDLIESQLKRLSGQKDSGAFLPGHGGVLDRLDSLILGVPCYFILMQYVIN